MIPKVVFTYSWIYDQNWSIWIKTYKISDKSPYPSYRTIQSYIENVEKMWRKHEKKILLELSKVTGLKWKSKYILCYVVGKCVPFSKPLTMPIYRKNPHRFIDILIHELIHQLFTQRGNSEKTKKAWEYFYKKHKKYPRKTKIHIPLHAIHSHIYLKFFGEKRLQEGIKRMQRFPA